VRATLRALPTAIPLWSPLFGLLVSAGSDRGRPRAQGGTGAQVAAGEQGGRVVAVLRSPLVRERGVGADRPRPGPRLLTAGSV
jgi:hypothetical protein